MHTVWLKRRQDSVDGYCKEDRLIGFSRTFLEYIIVESASVESDQKSYFRLYTVLRFSGAPLPGYHAPPLASMVSGLLLGPLPAKPLDGAGEGHVGASLPLLGRASPPGHSMDEPGSYKTENGRCWPRRRSSHNTDKRARKKEGKKERERESRRLKRRQPTVFDSLRVNCFTDLHRFF